MHWYRHQNSIAANKSSQSATFLALLCQYPKKFLRWPVFNDANDVAHQAVVTAESINRKAADHVFDTLWRADQTLEPYQTTVAQHHPKISRGTAGVTPERQENRDKALQYAL